MNFGQIVAEARKRINLSQKDLAARVRKEDGAPISPQYLNDIEHNRRNPPSEHILEQMAQELDLSVEYLLYFAGELPEDIRTSQASPPDPETIKAAYKAFRKALKK